MAALGSPGARALLIGTGSHPGSSGLPPVPAVAGTLDGLGQALVGQCGLPEENLRVLRDPRTPTELGLAVAEAAEQAEDVLWVHFVGHGLVSPAGELYLATAATDPRPGRLAPTALAYTAVRDCVLQTPARSIVVVLDCCFSGRAVGTLGSEPAVEGLELARVHGGFVLAAAARDELALAVPGAPHTAFSGELIRLLTEGDPDGPAMLTLRQAARYLDRTLPSRGYPRPRHLASEWIDNLVLAPNPAYRPPARTVAPGGARSSDGHDPVGPAAGSTPPVCPYPGLAAFGPGQAQWFFGRERLTAELLDRLAARVEEGNALAVVGASGSGKSSLLGAGLLPALSKGGLPRPGSRDWPRLRMTPTEHPLSELATRLAVMGAGEAPALHRALAGDPRRITGIVRGLLEARAGGAATGGARLVLVVDQFEETFTLCESPLERKLFVASLTAAATGSGAAAEPSALVAFGLRADFFGQCAAFPALRPALNTPVVVGPMTEGEAGDAIARPALAVGLALQPGLLEVLARDLGARGAAGGAGEPMPGPGTLPLLAHALRATWRHREGDVLTLAAYRDAGGIDGAVATTAEDVYGRMSPAQRLAARWTMLRLVRVAPEGQDTRRRERTGSLLRAAADPHAVGIVLDVLAAARLLTLDADSVEIAHEALLRAWPRLRQWIEADRAGNLLRQELEEAAAAWDRAGRDPGLLYRGTVLDEAQARTDPSPTGVPRAEPGDGVSSTASAFVEASVRQRRRAVSVRRSVVAVLATLALIAAGTAFVALRQRATARAERNAAVYEQLVTEADNLRGTRLPVAAQLDLAAYRMRPDPANYTHLVTDAAGGLSTAVHNGSRGVQSMAFGPDGRIAAAGGDDGTVRLWNFAVPDRPRRIGPVLPGGPGTVYSVALSPRGHVLAAGNLGGAVRLWNVADPAHPVPLGGPITTPSVSGGAPAVFSLRFAPDGRTLAAGEGDGTVRLWNVADPAHPERRGTVRAGTPGTVFSVAFAPGGHLLASGDLDGTVRLWNVAAPGHPAAVGKPLKGPASSVYAVAFSPDGRIVAAAGDDGAVRLWGLADPARPAPLGPPLTGPVGAVWSLAFSPDGQALACGGTDDTVRLWNLADPARPTPLGAPLTGDTGVVWSLAFSPDGRRLAAAGGDDTIRLWSRPAGPGPLLAGGAAPVRSVVFSPDGRTLASADSLGFLRLWNVTDPARPVPAGRPFRASGGGSIVSLAFAPTGHTLAAGDTGGAVRRWNVADPARPVSLAALPTDHHTTAVSVAFSPDGRTLAVGGLNSSVQLWDVSDPKRARALASPPVTSASTAFGLAFGPGGRILAEAGGDGTVRLWSLARPGHPVALGRPLMLPGGSSAVYAVAFGPDGHVLASAGGDERVHLWDVRHPTAARPLGTGLSGHTGSVFSLAFNHDSRVLASGGADGTVRLWDLSDPARATERGVPLTGHTSTVYSVAFSPDGRTLASGGNDTTVRLWPLDASRAVRTVCAGGDPITATQWHHFVPQLPYDPPCAAGS